MQRTGTSDLRVLLAEGPGQPTGEPPLGDASDQQLIAQVLAGSVNTFALLLSRYRAYVWTIVSRLMPEAMVPDLAQEVFVEAYRSLAGYDTAKPFKNWLAGIALHRCRDHWRQTYRRREIPLSALSEEHQNWLERFTEHQSNESFDSLARQREAREILDQALARLSPDDRLVLSLVYLEGLSIKEAARMLNWSLINVKVRAYRARKKMRTYLGALLDKEER